MATINSIIVGRATGRIGNVQLVRGKQTQILRTTRSKTGSSNFNGQNESRAGFKNCVWVYNSFRSFVKLSKPARKGKGNAYNTFISDFKNSCYHLFSNDFYFVLKYLRGCYSNHSIFPFMSGRAVFKGQIIKSCLLTETQITVTFENLRLVPFGTMKLYAFSFSNHPQSAKLIPYVVTLSEFNSGSYTCDFVGTATPLTAVILVSNDFKFCSNIYFSNTLNN